MNFLKRFGEAYDSTDDEDLAAMFVALTIWKEKIEKKYERQ